MNDKEKELKPEKESKAVWLEGESLETFKRLKKKLMLENESDVLRFAINFTERKFEDFLGKII